VKKTVEERFWEKVDIRGPDDCWEWISHKFKRGYGKFYLNGQHTYAHRYIFTRQGILLSTSDSVCHTCDNPSCVNPRHLILADQTYNIRDCVRKGRHKPSGIKGSASSNAKLSEDIVRAIRSDPRTDQELALCYGVRYQTIYKVRRNITWAHVA